MSTTYNCVHYDRDRMRSCIYGLAVGDALGVPYESRGRGTFECTGMAGDGTHGRYAGTWSDDTSMALCTCASIKRRGFIDTADIAHRFRRRLEHGDCTCDGRVSDAGDGPLMGTAPLAMLDPVEPHEIREVSAITHAHPVAEWSGVALCDILRTVRDAGTPAKGDLWHRYGYIASRPVGAVENDGRRAHTLEAALWCFLNTASYADCVLTAVNLGGDTGTAAAAAGAIAGVYYGFGAIPPGWVGRLRGKAVINQCI